MKNAHIAYSNAAVVPESSAILGARATPAMPITPVMTASSRMAKRRKESRVVVAGAVMAVMELPFDGWVERGGRGGPHAVTSCGGGARPRLGGGTPDRGPPGILGKGRQEGEPRGGGPWGGPRPASGGPP